MKGWGNMIKAVATKLALGVSGNLEKAILSFIDNYFTKITEDKKITIMKDIENMLKTNGNAQKYENILEDIITNGGKGSGGWRQLKTLAGSLSKDVGWTRWCVQYFASYFGASLKTPFQNLAEEIEDLEKLIDGFYQNCNSSKIPCDDNIEKIKSEMDKELNDIITRINLIFIAMGNYWSQKVKDPEKYEMTEIDKEKILLCAIFLENQARIIDSFKETAENAIKIMEEKLKSVPKKDK